MAAVRVVQVTAHQVVRVVAVRNCFVSTIRPVFVAFLMGSAIVIRRTRCRVFSTYCDLVLVNMVAVCVVKVSIVEIVLVAVVLHDYVSAIRTMHMRVRFVNFVIGFQFGSP